MNTTTKNKTETFLTSNCRIAASEYRQLGGDNPMEACRSTPQGHGHATPADKSGQIKKGDVVSYDLLAMKAS